MQLDDALQRFLVALRAAEYAGASTNINQIGFVDTVSPLTAFMRCKAKFLVMGEPSSAWITPAGLKAIGAKPD